MNRDQANDTLEVRSAQLFRVLINSPLQNQALELVRKIHSLTQAQIEKAFIEKNQNANQTD